MPAKFRGAVKTCKTCGSTFKVSPSRAEKAEYCSTACASVGRGLRQRKRSMLTCDNCGSEFEAHTCHAHRRKFCSRKCQHESEASWQSKHLRTTGLNNPRWKGGIARRTDGYVYQSAPYHPYASNGYVLQHRLIMEAWLRDNDPESIFLIRLGENLYLSPEFHVHHKDMDRANNAVSNLQCVTPAEHQRIHAEMRRNA